MGDFTLQLTHTELQILYDYTLPVPIYQFAKRTGPPFGSRTESLKKAVQINTVIKCIYGFLHLKDLKNCRLVSQKWNFVAEPIVRKRARISFCANHDDPMEGDKCRTLQEFAQDFLSSGTSVPFTSFTFSGNNWKVSELSEFFAINRATIKKLRIRGIVLKNEMGTPIKTFDINPWIRNAPLTFLHLDFSGRATDEYKKSRTHFKLCLANIKCVKDLCLDEVLLDVSDMSPRLKPAILKLEELKFSHEGSEVEEYRLNDSVDFSEAQDVTLMFNENSSAECKIELDLGETFNLEEMTSYGIKYENWSSSKSTINEFEMEGSLLEKTGMNIKFMTININSASIDLSKFPSTLEKLCLLNLVQTRMSISCTEPINFPNLKVLQLRGVIILGPVLSFFTQCVTIDEVQIIECESQTPVNLDLNLLPKNTMKLKITGAEKIIGTLSLETLIVCSATLGKITKILTAIAPRVLIFDWEQKFDINDCIIKFIKMRSLPTFVGPFLWEEFKFESSYLAREKFVAEEATYYGFQNQKGISVEKYEFDDLSDRLALLFDPIEKIYSDDIMAMGIIETFKYPS